MNEERNINVTITPGTIIKTIAFLILIAVLYYIKDIVLVVLAAVVIASAIEPFTVWCMNRKIGRLPSVVGIYIAIGIFLVLFIAFFLPLVFNDAFTYLGTLPDSINIRDLWSPAGDSSLFTTLTEKSFSIKEFIEMSRNTISGTSGGGTFKIASILFGGALSFVLIVVLSFYFAVQKDGVTDFLRVISPVKHHDYIIDLWKRSQRKIGYWMQGQLLLGVIVGILVYPSLMIFGIKHALVLAVLAATFEIIPIFGPILAAVPAVLIALVDNGLASGIIVIGIYLIIQQFENHLLYPLVVRKIVGVSPIIVILALVIGAKLAGFLGAILAVPIAAALMEFVEDIEKEKRADRQIT